uniref:Uncharacterized protein n=1 Tax=Arundo donax TaxID=35708 RepID=A0A0A9AXD8_ARUDO
MNACIIEKSLWSSLILLVTSSMSGSCFCNLEARIFNPSSPRAQVIFWRTTITKASAMFAF